MLSDRMVDGMANRMANRIIGQFDERRKPLSECSRSVG